MSDLLFYLPGTADNLLFLTLAVLVLLIVTGIYGYLGTQLNATVGSQKKLQWGWPALSLFALVVLFFWFGQPLSEGSISKPRELVMLVSPFLTGFIAISAGAAAVLSSNLKWALASAMVSFLTSGLLFLQSEVLPLVLICWLIMGGTVLLFLYRGNSEESREAHNPESESPFREPFLSCLVCGFLLCCSLWVVHREWSAKPIQTTAPEQSTTIETLILVRGFLTEHWPTLILLLVFVAVSFVGISRLFVEQSDSERFRLHDQREVH